MTGGNGRDDDREDGPDPVENDDERGAAAPGADEPKGMAAVDEDPADVALHLKKERDDLRDQLLRKRAEFENYRKRVERDRNQSAEDARAELLRVLIPTLDNLDRALASPTLDGLREGVELTRRNLVSALETQGLVALDPLFERFDPERHQALAHEPAPGHPEDTVVEVFGKGYTYKDRLLRPAIVKVSAGEPDGGGDPGAIH